MKSSKQTKSSQKSHFETEEEKNNENCLLTYISSNIMYIRKSSNDLVMYSCIIKYNKWTNKLRGKI